MTPKQKAAMRQALEALGFANEYLEAMGKKLFPESKKSQPGSTTWHVQKAITALREAQAEQAVEPVAKVVQNEAGQIHITDCAGNTFDMAKYVGASFYISPEPAAWVGLTDMEVCRLYEGLFSMESLKFARAIEAKLREKNGGAA